MNFEAERKILTYLNKYRGTILQVYFYSRKINIIILEFNYGEIIEVLIAIIRNLIHSLYPCLELKLKLTSKRPSQLLLNVFKKAKIR